MTLRERIVKLGREYDDWYDLSDLALEAARMALEEASTGSEFYTRQLLDELSDAS